MNPAGEREPRRLTRILSRRGASYTFSAMESHGEDRSREHRGEADESGKTVRRRHGFRRHCGEAGRTGVAGLVLAAVLVVVFLPAAGGPERDDEILVAGASDLRFAFEEMAEAFEAETGTAVTFSFGSSGLLAQQIENGAPFDLYFSANREYVERIYEGGFAAGEPVVYAIGYLALVVPEGEPLPEISDLHKDRFEAISIANPSHAPYGFAAQQAITASGLYADVEDRLVYGDNVLDALRLVESGNADVGLVALAFLDHADGIAGRRVDDALHEPIEQTAVVLGDGGGRANDGRGNDGSGDDGSGDDPTDGAAGTHGNRPDRARAFLDFVRSEAGQEIMRRYRFGTPGE